MQQRMWPVDVICLSSSDGDIRPLRIRASEGVGETIVGNVCEILATQENTRLGAESRTFLCRIRAAGATSVMELKFYIRSHCWYMSRVEP